MDETGKIRSSKTESINRRSIRNMDAALKNSMIEALCGRYYALFMIGGETDTLDVMYMPDRYNEIVRETGGYESGKDYYCDNFVCEADRARVKRYTSLENLAATLDYNRTAEISYKTVDDRYMSARAVELKSPDAGERTFLLGIVKYEHELEEEQRITRNNDIITALAESYQVIYRVNLVTGAYEIILMNFDRSRFVDNFKSFFELEKNYIKNGVDILYLKDNAEEPSIENVKRRLKNSMEPMEAYYKEKSGRWLKLVVTPDKNYSEEQPYVIYAIQECEEQIKQETESIIDMTAVSKMYTLVLIIDEASDYCNCMYSQDRKIIAPGPGKYSDFINTMKKLIYEEDYYIFESLLGEAVPGSKNFVEREYRAEDSRGMVHFLSGFSTYVMLPEGGRKLLLVRNIDERAANKARINLLDDQTVMLRNALFALGDAYFGIYYCNLETGIISAAREEGAVNGLCARNDNYTSVMEKYISEYVSADDRDRVRRFTDLNNLKRAFAGEGQTLHCEFLMLTEGGCRWVSMDVHAIRFKGGKVNETVLALKDIHDERAAELKHKKELKTALMEAEKASKAKSEFLSNISHDLRTPMNAVIGMTDIALNHMEEHDRVKSCLTRIDTAAKYLLNLINDVLDMSYIESGKLTVNEENFSLPLLIHGIIGMMQQQVCAGGLNFTARTYNIQNEELFGDRVKLDRILTNVISNAVKYTAPGGTVKFTIEQKEDLSDKTACYVFRVEDNGCGMSREFVDKIYQPFEREHPVSHTEGTGLGMSITGKYVGMLGGKIDIDSEEGVGTAFEITLPFKYTDRKNSETFEKLAGDFDIIRYDNVTDDIIGSIKRTAASNSGRPIIVTGTYDAAVFEKEAYGAGMKAYIHEPVFLSDLEKLRLNTDVSIQDQHRKDSDKYDFTGKKILVVDDNVINADIAVDYLTDVHAICEIAADGKEAYDRIASGEYFDAVLMDVRMPVMNGCEAASRIRSLGGDYACKLPIIAMTANSFKQDIELTRKSGMDDHISKPMCSDTLYSVLKKYLS